MILISMLSKWINSSYVIYLNNVVHERDMNTDFLLIILKKLLQKRVDLKVILMSATLKADLFASYFAEFGCQSLNIPGRAFPVTSYYLEDTMNLVRGRIQLPYTHKSPYVYAGKKINKIK